MFLSKWVEIFFWGGLTLVVLQIIICLVCLPSICFGKSSITNFTLGNISGAISIWHESHLAIYRRISSVIYFMKVGIWASSTYSYYNRYDIVVLVQGGNFSKHKPWVWCMAIIIAVLFTFDLFSLLYFIISIFLMHKDPLTIFGKKVNG